MNDGSTDGSKTDLNLTFAAVAVVRQCDEGLFAAFDLT